MTGEALAALFRRVSDALERVPFDGIWHGFARMPFALYTSELVCLSDGVIPWDERFRGNTAISFGDSYLAIWDVEHDKARTDDAELLVLASCLVHEMFHAFQMQRGETRFPQDLVTLDYPWDAVNFSQKLAENRLLVAGVRTEDTEQKREALAGVLRIRSERQRRIGPIMLDAERLSETAEGMAEYAGLRALRTLSAEQMSRNLSQHLDCLENPGEMLFDIRRISYSSGAMLLWLAAGAGVDFFHDVGTENRPVSALIEQKLSSVQASVPADLQSVESAMHKALAARRVQLDAFFAVPRERTEGDFRITGYDPMNMWKTDGRILCAHFVCLSGESGDVFVEGPVALASGGAPDAVTGYWR